jgi:protein SCO1/2
MKQFLVCIGLVFGLQLQANNNLPFYENHQMTPFWQTDIDAGKFTPAKVGNFKAINQSGKLINKENMPGKISLVNFFFVQCPGICPLMMKSVRKVQKALSKIDGVNIYSFSVRPENDTPDKLMAYSKQYDIDLSSWTLLTGKKDVIYKVGKKMFQADASVGEQKSEDSFIHTENIYLVDENLYIRGIYNTSDSVAMDNLKKDVQSLKALNKSKLAKN